MAVKKKSAAKKIVKKASAKRTVKKSAAKKAAVKKAPARKTVAKKRVVKKVTAKRTVKKSAAKKAAVKKAPTKKRAAKKIAKKAPAKRSVKKSTVKTAPSRVAVLASPAVPVISKPVALAPKPVAVPKQKASGRVVFFVVIGIILLAMTVWSKSGKEGDLAPKPAPSMSDSAEPSESATAEPSKSAEAVAVVEAPSKFVALKSSEGLTLRWIAPSATDGLTGYNVEIRARGAGDWLVIATLPADQLTQSVSKSSDSGWTQFRVSSLYSDGQIASATAFGIPGEFK